MQSGRARPPRPAWGGPLTQHGERADHALATARRRGQHERGVLLQRDGLAGALHRVELGRQAAARGRRKPQRHLRRAPAAAAAVTAAAAAATRPPARLRDCVCEARPRHKRPAAATGSLPLARARPQPPVRTPSGTVRARLTASTVGGAELSDGSKQSEGDLISDHCHQPSLGLQGPGISEAQAPASGALCSASRQGERRSCARWTA